jgi:hypothetical protein
MTVRLLEIALTPAELVVLTDNLATLLAQAGEENPRYVCPATEAGRELTALYTLTNAFQKLSHIRRLANLDTP